METVYLGIGTNLGEREKNLKRAIELIGEHIGTVKLASSVYETEPWGFQSENSFLNMVIMVETVLRPSGLMGRILMIESLMGRQREGEGYKPRIIDVDILFFGKRIMNTKVLTIPHPLIRERRFVLVPFNEIADELIHPVLGKSISALLEECPDRSRVEKL